MGGIKNKVKQLSNKTIPLSDYRLPSPFSQRGTKSSLPLAKGRQMSVAHRWGRITKYTSITCLTLAILSTLVLNIVSSYSYSKVNSNAEPVSEVSTLDNNNDSSTCDPSNTNAESCISLSITSSTSTGSNDPNPSLSIPQGGGIATGRHTVEVSTGSSVIGYELQLSSNSNETALVSNDASSTSNSNSKPTIPTTTGTIDNPSILADRTYGYTLTDLSSGGAYGGNDDVSNTYSDNPAVNTAIWSGLQPSTSPATIATVDETDDILTIGQANETTHDIYYGVNVQNPAEIRAGNYSRGVVYTAVGKIAPIPDVGSITPIEYPLNNKVTSIDNSGINLFAITADGSVYRYDKYSSKWSNVAFSMCKVIDYHYASFTTDAGYGLCQDGRLYVWGGNSYGQLGIGNTESVNAESPTDISGLLESSVRSVSINSFSIALTDNGQVYTWGDNSDGQLGVGDFENRLSPVNITDNFSLSSDDRVIAICKASRSVFALTEHGRVFSWGTNFGDQLGNGDSSREDQPLPVEITDSFSLNSSSEKVVALQAGGGSVGGTAYVLALTNTGRVFAWGINEYGQLGDGSGGADSVYGGRKGSPVDITDYFNLSNGEIVKRIMVGRQSSYATTNFGRIFGWGAWYWNRTVQTTPLDITDKLSNSDIVQFAYNQPVYALDGNGKIYASSEDASAVWNLLPDPDYVSPNITLTGSNFTNVNNVYIDLNADGTMQSNEQCTDLTVNSDTELTCNVPTDNNIATGDYTMYIETPYNYTTTAFRYENYGE